jgi:DNA-binding SARP family transcriptional activator
MEARAHRSGAVSDLTVKLLGRIEVGTDAAEVRLAGRQAQALFALLVLQPRPRTRDSIAADLWPDADGASSASLRQALWLVRSGLSGAGLDPDDLLEVDGDIIGMRPAAGLDIDAARFEAALGADPARPDEAVRIYRGDLAEGLGHECFAAERERLADSYEDALALLAERRLLVGDLEGSRRAALLLLGRDQLREEAHVVLIRVYGAAGSRSQVHRQYRRLRNVLARELEVEPLPETEAAYAAALAQTVERSRRRVASSVFASGSSSPVFVGTS